MCFSRSSLLDNLLFCPHVYRCRHGLASLDSVEVQLPARRSMDPARLSVLMNRFIDKGLKFTPQCGDKWDPAQDNVTGDVLVFEPSRASRRNRSRDPEP